MKRIFPLVLFLVVSFSLSAQFTKVTGTVTAFHEFPLYKVVVKAKKSNAQVSTNEKGEFVIMAANNDVIIFQAEGFSKVKKKVKKSGKHIMVDMVFKDNEINKTKIIESGYLSEAELVQGISALAMQKIDFSLYTNMFDLIRDNVPGVQIINENGKQEFLLRGHRSLLGSNAALLVVNGMTVNDFKFLMPSDVKNIDVLKGSAASFYGSRGGNGVIVITTK